MRIEVVWKNQEYPVKTYHGLIAGEQCRRFGKWSFITVEHRA